MKKLTLIFALMAVLFSGCKINGMETKDGEVCSTCLEVDSNGECMMSEIIECPN